MSAATEWEHDVRLRLTAGDQDTLGDCYDQYSSFVFGLAQRVIGDRRAAEDVTQDVFLYLWERSDAYDPRHRGMRTWLGTLTHRRSVDYVRREEARRRRTQRVGNEAPVTPDGDRWPWRSSRRNGCCAALETLPVKQREAIFLAYFGGKTSARWRTNSRLPKAPRNPACASAWPESPMSWNTKE